LASGARLSLLIAPAGFGKSSLAVDWLSQLPPADRGASAAPYHSIWLSLAEQDNDPLTFLSHLVAAGQTVVPDLLPLPEQRPPPPTALLAALLTALARQPRPLVLVLDDYHLLTQTAVHELVAQLLADAPPNLHLMLIGRTRPPLALARLRAHGQVIELSTEELRFTAAESAALLALRLSPPPSPSLAEALHTLTEGWAAALNLATVYPNTPHHYIINYLLEEVWQQQPAALQDFLLETAILDQLSAPLCDAVTARSDSRAMLQTVADRQLLLQPLDDSGNWYRYHALLLTMLRHRLETTRPEQVGVLRRRAVDWYRRHDHLPEAVQQALAIPDYALAAELIATNAPALWLQGQAALLLHWLEALPVALLEKEPSLRLWQVWCLLLMGHWDAARPALRLAERALSAWSVHDELPSAWMGLAAAVHAEQALLDNRPQSAARWALDGLERLSPGELIWRGVLTHTLGDAYRISGDWRAADKAYGEAEQLNRAAANLSAAITAVRYRGELLQQQGRLHQAARYYQQAQALARQDLPGRGPRLAATGHVHLWLGRLYLAQLDLAAAVVQLTQGIDICRCAGHAVGVTLGHAWLGQVHFHDGAVSDADTALQTAEAAAQQAGLSRLQPYLETIRIQWLLAQVRDGKDEAALQQAATRVHALGLSENTITEYSYRAQALVAYWLQSGRQIGDKSSLAQARRLLSALQAPTANAGRTEQLIRLLIMQALVAQAQERLPAALDSLQQAVALAAPEGNRRAFVSQGPPLRQLLDHLLLTGHLATFAIELAQLIGVQVVKHQLAWAPLPTSDTLAPAFTQRELDVLQLLAAGHSNRQMAQRLVVAESTIKTHLNNIYRKLDVGSRTAALARLRELNLDGSTPLSTKRWR
jgi:LuxR family maltose regulon positive regulatory protein